MGEQEMIPDALLFLGMVAGAVTIFIGMLAYDLWDRNEHPDH